jgi:hypothetical protein
MLHCWPPFATARFNPDAVVMATLLLLLLLLLCPVPCRYA